MGVVVMVKKKVSSKRVLALKEIKKIMGKRKTIDFKEIVAKAPKIQDLDTRELMSALIHWDVNGFLKLQMKKPL